MEQIDIVDFVNVVKETDKQLGIKAELLLTKVVHKGLPRPPKSCRIFTFLMRRYITGRLLESRGYTTFLIRSPSVYGGDKTEVVVAKRKDDEYKEGTSIPLYLPYSGLRNCSLRSNNQIVHFLLDYKARVSNIIYVGRKQYDATISELVKSNETHSLAKLVANKYELEFENRFLKYMNQDRKDIEKFSIGFKKGIENVFLGEQTLDKIILEKQKKEQEYLKMVSDIGIKNR